MGSRRRSGGISPTRKPPMPAARPADSRTVALVTTTINVPRCLEAYLENIEKHGHGERVALIVVGDRKTPPATAEYLSDLDKRFAARVTYLDVSAQQRFL